LAELKKRAEEMAKKWNRRAAETGAGTYFLKFALKYAQVQCAEGSWGRIPAPTPQSYQPTQPQGHAHSAPCSGFEAHAPNS